MYSQNQVEIVFDMLVSSDPALRAHYDEYMLTEYNGDISDRLDYLDIAEIARCIVDKVKNNDTEFLTSFFENVEVVLSNCDEYIENLIVIGLFESIQNNGYEIDYYKGFNRWLKPHSKKNWDELIDSWEGKYWRKK